MGDVGLQLAAADCEQTTGKAKGSPESMTLLEVRDLKKAFGTHRAVNGVSFSVKEGEIFGLLGPNGAGKSTTLSMICGLLRANGGSVEVGSWNMAREASQAKQLIGIVPQEPAIYPMLSARDNLRFWGTINGVPPGRMNEAVENALDVVGLRDRAGQRASTFSGGMKRRLNIAAGLIHRPRLLIMDEPTVGIDPQSRNHILETVKRFRDEDMTVIYTSHYVEEIEYLCNRVAIMDHGRIIAEGTLAELLQQGSEYQEVAMKIGQPSETIVEAVASLPGVETVQSLNGQLRITTSSAEQVLPMAFQAITGHGGIVSETTINKPNLEGLFLKLTGRALRD